MIEARFQITADAGSGYPALTPDHASWPKAVELAKMLGVEDVDLIRIDLPAGASRHGTVKVLVPTEKVASIFDDAASTPDGGMTFRWGDTPDGPKHSLRVWPIRCTPVSWPTMGGWVEVEAVDARYQAQFRAAAGESDAAAGPMRTDDGRFLARTASGSDYSESAPMGSMLAFCQYLAAQAQLSVDWRSFDPPSISLYRINGLGASWQDAATLVLDQCMALCGWILVPDTTTGTLTAVQIGEDVETLSTWLKDTDPYGKGYGTIGLGGIQATGDSFAGTCDLVDAWNACATVVEGLGPYASRTSAIRARPEGLRRYDNQYSPQSDEGILTPGTGYATDRPMSLNASWGKATLYGWTVVPRNEENLTFGWPTPEEIAEFADGVWGQRSRVAFGAQAWLGWPFLPLGSYRATQCSFCLRWQNGKPIPVTLTKALTSDWLLGNDGRLNTRPDQMLTGIGNIDTQITPGGGRLIRVPPPQVRSFVARITNYTQIGDEWRWQYEWEQVEPNTPLLSDEDRWAASPPLTLAWDSDGGANYLENVIERGNIVGSRVAPGILQSDLPTGSTLEALPLPVGTLVHVQQLAPTVWPDSNDPKPPAYVYTCCVPNGIKVTCP